MLDLSKSFGPSDCRVGFSPPIPTRKQTGKKLSQNTKCYSERLFCHPERSAAPTHCHSERSAAPTHCHPERSAAESKDLALEHNSTPATSSPRHCEKAFSPERSRRGSEAISLHNSLFLVRRRIGPALTDSIFTTTLTFLLLLFLIASPAYAKYGGGTGEPNDPYLIYDANQMNAIGACQRDWGKHFRLMADIDLGSYTGTAFNIIGYRVSSSDNKPFTGVFDGNGHTISNFTYTSTGINCIGLFGYLGDPNAEIKGLGLIDPYVNVGTGYSVGSLVGWLRDGTITACYVEDGSIPGDTYVGGLVGINYRGTISNCYSTAVVSGNYHVGGLVGRNYEGTITDCYSTGTVSGYWYVGGLVGGNSYGTVTECYASGDVSGDKRVGGLIGWSYGGTISNCDSYASVSGNIFIGGLAGSNHGLITNCYSSGDVSGDENVGGLAGSNYFSTITNCYSTGSVLGDRSVGGLLGKNYYRATITNCYSTGGVSGHYDVGGLVGENGDYSIVSASFWDVNTSGQTTSDGGTGLPTDQMQMQVTFTDAGWDFTTPVWTIDEGADYPRLWWQFVPVLHAEPEVTLGTSNTITWDPVPGANDYYAECAEDTNFTSIIYNTGWITETSYEFTGLQLGQRYWYSVKARNAAGVETDWSNVESSLQGTLADLVDAIDTMLDPESLKNENMKSALLNKIIAVQQMVDEGLYKDALNKLQNDILQKTDGCAETGRPDKNDWIITCEEQGELYPLIIETIENVKGLMNQ